MPGTLRKKTILQIFIFSVLTFIFVNIWPLKNIEKHNVFKANQDEITNVTFTKNDKLLMQVQFQENHIGNIVSYLSVKQYNEFDRVMFRMYDEQFTAIYFEEVRCELIERDQKVTINVDLDVEPGKNYYYEWIVHETQNPIETTLIIPLSDKDALLQKENVLLFIDGNCLNNLSYVSDYDYTKNFSTLEIIIIAVLMMLGGTGLYFGLIFILDRFEVWNKEEKIWKILKYLVTIFTIVAGTVAFILSVIVNIWGGNLNDRVVYAIGILTLCLWIFGAIWLEHKSVKKPTENPVYIWKNYIQAMCFALAIFSACRFVNAEYELIHTINTRRLVTYLIIAFLMIPDRINRPDYKFWKNWNLPMAGLWVLMMILMVANKTVLTWPPVIILFGAPLLCKMSPSGQKRLLNNFAWGVYISFFITTYYCLMHRPYNTWVFYRYSGMFHTVAYTGMYLSTVVAVSAARVFSKIKQNRKMLQYCYFDLFMLTTSIGYVLLSMTRTAILSIAVAFIIAIILVVIGYKKEIIQVIKELAIIAILCILSFCMTFSATRMIPAIVNEPIYMDIEGTQEFGVCKGEKIDSSRYLRFNRYISVMLGRFGHAFETSDIRENQKFNQFEEAKTLLASTNIYKLPATVVTTNEDSNLGGDLSNGRLDIFKIYIKNITWQNHEGLSLPTEEVEYAHAHNTFIQIAYTFGLLTGIVFVVLCIYTFIVAISYFFKNKNNMNSLVPLALVVVFLVTCMVEWTYQPGIPIGFCFMFTQTFLMKRAVEGKDNK